MKASTRADRAWQRRQRRAIRREKRVARWNRAFSAVADELMRGYHAYWEEIRKIVQYYPDSRFTGKQWYFEVKSCH